MLKKRIITASILLPLVLGALFTAPILVINILIALVFSLAAMEWVKLVTKTRLSFGLLLGLMLVLGAGSWWLSLNFSTTPWFMAATAFWFVVLANIFSYPKASNTWKSLGFLVGLFVLLPSFVSLIYLNMNYGPKFLLYVLCIVWCADIGAYFSGKKFGKHKLAPNLSPGKTMEGVVGALIATFILACIGSRLLDINLSKLVLITLVVALFSVVGDLLESLYKRLKGVKDSGNLLPGHGGVLDRLDSLFAVLPIFLVMYESI